MQTFFIGNLPITTSAVETNSPGINALQREQTAITIEKAAAAMILNLGSNRWTNESPCVKPLSNIYTKDSFTSKKTTRGSDLRKNALVAVCFWLHA